MGVGWRSAFKLTKVTSAAVTLTRSRPPSPPLGEDFDGDGDRGLADLDERRVEGDQVADVDRLVEDHFPHRNRHDEVGAVPFGFDRRGLVDVGSDTPPKMVPWALVSLGIMMTRMDGSGDVLTSILQSIHSGLLDLGIFGGP
jgi:hypothetical protein